MQERICRPLLSSLLIVCWIVPLRAQETEDLRGVWTLVSYTRDGRSVDREAMMIITQHHFTRILTDKKRQKFDFDFRQVDKLTAEQQRQVAESFPQFNASAGTYRMEAGTFYFTSSAHHNPGAVRNESKRRIDLKGDRVRLYGPAGSGYLEEIWERVERF